MVSAMKKKLLASFICGISLLFFGTFTGHTDFWGYSPIKIVKADADGVVRVTTPYATVYNAPNGNSTRTLPMNSAWKFDKRVLQNGMYWYRVSPSEWINDTQCAEKITNVWYANGVVTVQSGKTATVRVAMNGRSTGQTLGSNTQWRYDIKATDNWGYTWYRVTTSGWVSSYEVNDNNNKGQQIANVARQYVGYPYSWGGSSPSTGFDCSGLVQYVYNKCGIELPRISQQQSTRGYAVSMSSLQPGDLLFWGSTGSAYHVAIYLGNNQYIHAPQPGQTVTIQNINAWYPDFAIRVI